MASAASGSPTQVPSIRICPSHPIPPEALPDPSYEDLHGPLGIMVWNGHVTLNDIAFTEWLYDNMPEIFCIGIEGEYHAQFDDVGWYYPKTKASAKKLDEYFHEVMNGEFGPLRW